MSRPRPSWTGWSRTEAGPGRRGSPGWPPSPPARTGWRSRRMSWTTRGRSRSCAPGWRRSTASWPHPCRRAGPALELCGWSGGHVGVGEGPQLLERLALQLTDPLGRDAVLGADVRKLVHPAVDETVARPDDVGGPVVEPLHQVAEPVAGLDVDEVRVGPRCGGLRDQVAERGVPVVVDRGVEAHVLTAPRHQVDDPVDVHAELGGDVLGLRVVAELALQSPPCGVDLVDLLDHVDW